MKKFIKKIMLACAVVAVSFGVAFAPVVAVAENADRTAGTEVSQELETKTTDTDTETLAPNEDTATEETEETPNTENDGTGALVENPTFEEFLAAVQKEAEKYGLGEEYAKAIDNLKTAASTKQVTISTVCSAAVALGVLVYIIYSKVKDRTLKKEVHELFKLSKGQNDGTNALIDEANAVEKAVKETDEKTTEAKRELDNVQTAMSCLISAFLAFSDGHKYSETKKQEVERNCVKALKMIDGGDKNENNAK
ncbi:MAG: hypothetical protein IIX02_06925 [Clostridia bacterium]|nr:hypothetical protein [Clostridia bacterium]